MDWEGLEFPEQHIEGNELASNDREAKQDRRRRPESR